VVDVDSALQSQVRNIESTYGRTPEQWFEVIDKSALTRHNDVVLMLKTDHGMAHGAAHRVSLLARARASGQGAAPTELTAVVDELYSGRRAALRPLHEELMSTVLALGEVEVAPKKGYLSLRRRKQFAKVQPSTATRIDLGLILPTGTRSDNRLESASSFNALFTHRVRISSSAHIDDQVVGWLRAAYDTAG
jgi:hypothetical protein